MIVVALYVLRVYNNISYHRNTQTKLIGVTREPKKILTYYDEENNNKRVLIYVEPNVFKKFQKEICYNKNNYKILKEMNII